jgi:hypothetical protein
VRAGEGFAPRKSLLLPDCAAGVRCGLVYLFEHDHRLRRLTRAIRLNSLEKIGKKSGP